MYHTTGQIKSQLIFRPLTRHPLTRHLQPAIMQKIEHDCRCQRQYKIVRKRRRNFVVFRRGGVTKLSVSLLKKSIHDLLFLTHKFFAFPHRLLHQTTQMTGSRASATAVTDKVTIELCTWLISWRRISSMIFSPFKTHFGQRFKIMINPPAGGRSSVFHSILKSKRQPPTNTGGRSTEERPPVHQSRVSRPFKRDEPLLRQLRLLRSDHPHPNDAGHPADVLNGLRQIGRAHV